MQAKPERSEWIELKCVISIQNPYKAYNLLVLGCCIMNLEPQIYSSFTWVTFHVVRERLMNK